MTSLLRQGRKTYVMIPLKFKLDCHSVETMYNNMFCYLLTWHGLQCWEFIAARKGHTEYATTQHWLAVHIPSIHNLLIIVVVEPCTRFTILIGPYLSLHIHIETAEETIVLIVGCLLFHGFKKIWSIRGSPKIIAGRGFGEME